jgi:hypothetical protein
VIMNGMQEATNEKSVVGAGHPRSIAARDTLLGVVPMILGGTMASFGVGGVALGYDLADPELIMVCDEPAGQPARETHVRASLRSTIIAAAVAIAASCAASQEQLRTTAVERAAFDLDCPKEPCNAQLNADAQRAPEAPPAAQ